MIPIKNLEKTCDSCPSQWEFTTFENRPVYVRYRWGFLSISIGKPNIHESSYSDETSALLYGGYLSDDMYDGHLEWETVLNILKKITKKEIYRKLKQRKIK